MEKIDIIIVGAGPAGLSAALYAARYCRSTLVLHDDSARALRIPLTHNAPGFEDGISGPDLIARMMRHASKYGTQFAQAHVARIEHRDGLFTLESDDGARWQARSVILATGLNLNQIPLDSETHETAIANAVLRYCPVCDGYEHKDARIGVIGCDNSGASEALFLSGYSNNVTLLPQQHVELTRQQRDDLRVAGIATVTEPIVGYEPSKNEMAVYLEGRSEPIRFDVVYPALGSRPRNELATLLGLEISDAGKVSATAPFETSIQGLYCAGDLVEGLDQISVAMGHGAVAATKAHNWLRDRQGETVEAVLR